MTDNNYRRGPLVDQLAQARQDATTRAVLDELPPILPHSLEKALSPETPAPCAARRAPEVHQEVRLGIHVETNMRDDPPPPPPPGWEPEPKGNWRVWRRGIGRIA